ncbi:hypothetical protein DMH04_27055 [Kibdelosporangium aridum]|uniref:Uncharacterized protein n=1 Tax=Kibdelosporangium aridum TaxID=2030 RepID=A0A428Z5E5_KIBAR|nr:hypothetical protein DMH04_27055 [Kibdelosporangium aridum]
MATEAHDHTGQPADLVLVDEDLDVWVAQAHHHRGMAESGRADAEVAAGPLARTPYDLRHAAVTGEMWP